MGRGSFGGGSSHGDDDFRGSFGGGGDRGNFSFNSTHSHGHSDIPNFSSPQLNGFILRSLMSPYRGYGVHFHSNSRATAILCLVIMIVLAIVLSLPAKDQNITASTVTREPLPASAVSETEYYTDEIGITGSKTDLENGMRYFFKKTGVQPYLYLTDSVDGTTSPSDSQLESFANTLYDDLFVDEGHLLMLLQDSGTRYRIWIVTGTQAKQVADNEALNILVDYIDRYYYDNSKDAAQSLGMAFEKTADRMMTKTIRPLTVFIVSFAGVFVIAIVAFVIVKIINEKKRRDEQTERMLNMDLSQSAEPENPDIVDLEKKYR